MATVEIIPVGDVAPVTKGAVPIRIEVEDVPNRDSTDFYSGVPTRGVVRSAAKALTRTAQQIYDEAIEMACEAAVQTAQHIATMDKQNRPSEFEVTFGLSIGMGGDTKIVSINSGAQVQVRMQWNRRPGD